MVDSTRPWVESDVCRLTAKYNNMLSKRIFEQFTTYSVVTRVGVTANKVMTF